MKSGTSPKLAADHIEKASFFEAPVGDLSSRAAGKPPRIGRDPRPSLADIPRKETISTAD
jgi:hypothetical protein